MKKEVVWVDLDGTLAKHLDAPDKGPDHHHPIGPPIKPMVDLLLKYKEEGHAVAIFTARVWSGQSYDSYLVAMGMIHEWMKQHLGTVDILVTAEKTPEVTLYLDDRARQVERNTGRIITDAKPNE